MVVATSDLVRQASNSKEIFLDYKVEQVLGGEITPKVTVTLWARGITL